MFQGSYGRSSSTSDREASEVQLSIIPIQRDQSLGSDREQKLLTDQRSVTGKFSDLDSFLGSQLQLAKSSSFARQESSASFRLQEQRSLQSVGENEAWDTDLESKIETARLKLKVADEQAVKDEEKYLKLLKEEEEAVQTSMTKVIRSPFEIAKK